MDADRILRLYARITSLKSNLPQGRTDQKYVSEYNSLLIELEQVVGTNLNEFKIPPSIMETQRYATGGDYDVLEGQSNVQYEYETFCDCEFALAKMDAITSYLNLRYFREEKTPMGFHPNS